MPGFLVQDETDNLQTNLTKKRLVIVQRATGCYQYEKPRKGDEKTCVQNRRRLGRRSYAAN